jgi:alpha-ketoglutarate-dependent taurine dioxygenase
MKLVQPRPYSSKEELYEDLQAVVDVYKKDGIVGIRGLHLDEKEHIQLVKDLGDILGWYPNNSSNFNHQYIENHSTNVKASEIASDPDEVILRWHLEHVDFDAYIPLVAGVWNMHKFNCNPESGKTYFLDSRRAYETIFSIEEQQFLKKCIATWTEDEAGLEKYETTIVKPHWITGEDQIRLELHHTEETTLLTVDGNEPTDEDRSLFYVLINRFSDYVTNNEDARIVHKWEEGDILVPDLFTMAHAVTGGFNPEDREFTGYWCYTNAPENVTQEQLHPKWRD